MSSLKSLNFPLFDRAEQMEDTKTSAFVSQGRSFGASGQRPLTTTLNLPYPPSKVLNSSIFGRAVKSLL